MLICLALPKVHVELISLPAKVTSERLDMTLGPRWRSRTSLGVRAGVRGAVGVLLLLLVVLEESIKEIVESR